MSRRKADIVYITAKGCMGDEESNRIKGDYLHNITGGWHAL